MTIPPPPDPTEADASPTGERLQRVLASRGVASRRASEDLIVAGRVTVNGKVVTELGTRVDPAKDTIRVDGKSLRRPKPRFIVLNKPSGFITTASDERQRWTVLDLVKSPERVYPVGRLDRDTQGLLLLTNEGEIAHRVTHPRYGLAKEYHVITSRRPTDLQLQRVRDGIWLDDRLVEPTECRLMRETNEGIVVRVVLHEGMFHVVRRMMDAVGIEVEKLRRVRIGPLSIQGIPLGAWRDLTPGELVQLYEAIGLGAAEAERLNAIRPIQIKPVGGFAHGSAGNDQDQRGGGSPRPGNRSPSPGRGQDAVRSPASHRDRRPRRGR